MSENTADIFAIVIGILTGFVSLYTIHAIRIHAYSKYKTQIKNSRQSKIVTQNKDCMSSNFLFKYHERTNYNYFSILASLYKHYKEYSTISCLEDREPFFSRDYSQSRLYNQKGFLYKDKGYSNDLYEGRLYDLVEQSNAAKTKKVVQIAEYMILQEGIDTVSINHSITESERLFNLIVQRLSNDSRLDIEESLLNWIIGVISQRSHIPMECNIQFHLIIATSFKLLTVLSDDKSTLFDWHRSTSEVRNQFKNFVTVYNTCNTKEFFHYIIVFEEIIESGNMYFRTKATTDVAVKSIQNQCIKFIQENEEKNIKH